MLRLSERNLTSSIAWSIYQACCTSVAFYALHLAPSAAASIVGAYFLQSTLGLTAYLGKRLWQKKLNGGNGEESPEDRAG